MRFISIILLLAVAGCGLFEKKDNEPQETQQPIEKLRAKAVKYANWTADLEDDLGVLPQFTCDSLLFQSLNEVATGGDLDITIYEGEDGEWFRKPSHDCLIKVDGEWVANGSKTTISRDMLLGLMVLLWDRQDLDAVKRTIDFGRNQNPVWFMGQGINVIERESRTHMRGPLLGTLFILVDELGGENNPIKKFPYLPTGKGEGYQLHLEVTHTLLRGQMLGGISDTELKALERASDGQPNNAYYSAVYHYFKDGDQSNAIRILLNESLFPADRLPTGGERCSDYIFQRTDDRGDPDPNEDDWKPCWDKDKVAQARKRAEVHPGTDFLWAFKIIDNTLVETKTSYPRMKKEAP